MNNEKIKELVKVELGCGPNKQNGYIGVDRYKLLGVDIVADLNKGLPFENDSVDVILAIHSLEHLDDLHHIMSEIYRVCKHKAIVNIIAPYENQGSNIANLYHKIPFNEHTFRFFTKNKLIPFENDKKYYEVPGLGDVWGLSESDYSTSTMDFRVLNQELIFYPEYNDIEHETKMMLLQNFRNICSMIEYSLLVCKKEVDADEIVLCKNQANVLMNELSQYQLLKQHWKSVQYSRANIYTYYENKIDNIYKKYIQLQDNADSLHKEFHQLQNDIILDIKTTKHKLDTIEEQLFIIKQNNDEMIESNKLMKYIEKYMQNKKYNILEIIKMVDEEYYDDIVLNNERTIIKNIVLLQNINNRPYSEWLINNSDENSSIGLFILISFKTDFIVELVAHGKIISNKKYLLKKSGVLWVDIPHTESKIYIRIACINKYDTFSTLVLRNNSNKIFYIGDNCKKYM